MLFRLSNVLVSSWGYIDKFLAKKLKVFIIVYLNDILIYTKDAGQVYVKTIWWILKELKKIAFLPISKSVSFIKIEFDF